MSDENDHGPSCASRFAYNVRCTCGYDINLWTEDQLRNEVYRLRKKIKMIYKAINE